MDLFTNRADIERPDIAQLFADNWLATSALQKAIRRGQTASALQATSFLLEKQPARFWRRLVVIALEDIGIGDLDLVREVLLLSGRKAWREQNGGDWSFAAGLVTQLCCAIKCRDACDALVIADLHPAWDRQRSEFLDLSGHDLCKVVIDDARQIGERVLAAWLIAGTKRFPALSIPEREGSFDELMSVYLTLGVAPYVLEVARLGSTRTMEGHPLTLPLIWLLASGGTEKPTTKTETLKPSREIAGWPDYAYDMHTRVGKKAIKLFQHECGELNRFVLKNLPPAQQELFVGTLLFRLEGENVDRRLMYPGSQALLRTSEVAHLTYHGLPENLVTEALSTAQAHLDILYHCRTEAVRGYRT